MFELVFILIIYILMWVAFFFKFISLDTAIISSLLVVLLLPIAASYMDMDNEDEDEN